MTLEMRDQIRTPPSLRGAPPRYQVFDRRKDPPQTVARFYREPRLGGEVVFEVYDDVFREFLKREPAFAGKRFRWAIDVAPDAPHDTRQAIIRPDPMPQPEPYDPTAAETLTLEAALAACRAPAFYRVVRASDPV